MGYQDRVRHVVTGEPVSAGVTGRSTRDLESNLAWLRQLIEAAALGQGLFAREQSVETAAQVGQPVFWNAATSQFELAVAGVTISDESVDLTAASCVAGLVHTKHNATLADIAILGLFDLDLTAAAGPDPPGGQYYLSGMQNGMLTQQSPPVTVPVCFKYGDDKVIISPAWRNPVDDHVHYSFPLDCVPAGTHAEATAGTRHAITAPNAALPGWLPANHASFDGKAPAAAAFGYNFAAHAALGRVWPPIPITAVRVIWDKGRDYAGGAEVPMGEDGLVVVDAAGIWWMSDTYLDVPWPNWVFTAGETAETPGEQGEIEPELPRVEEMRLTIDYGRMNFATHNAVVTRLTTDSPLLAIVNCDGEPAQTGDLVLRLLLSLLQQDTDAAGHQVVKNFDADTLELQRGPVTEGLLAGTSVTLASDDTRLLDPDDISSATVYQGLVTVNADTDPSGNEFAWEVIRSDELRQRYDGNVIFLAFPAAHTSGLRAKVIIPPAGVPTNAQIKLKLTFLCVGPGTLPEIAATYRRIPAGTASPAALPSGDTVLASLTLPPLVVAGKQYFTVESAAFAVAAGDTVFITLSRAGNDGYSGEVGILRHTVALV